MFSQLSKKFGKYEVTVSIVAHWSINCHPTHVLSSGFETEITQDFDFFVCYMSIFNLIHVFLTRGGTYNVHKSLASIV